MNKQVVESDKYLLVHNENVSNFSILQFALSPMATEQIAFKIVDLASFHYLTDWRTVQRIGGNFDAQMFFNEVQVLFSNIFLFYSKVKIP